MRGPTRRCAQSTAARGHFVWLKALLIPFCRFLFLGHFVGAALRYRMLGSRRSFRPMRLSSSLLLVSRRRDLGLVTSSGRARSRISSRPGRSSSLSWVVWADVANIARALVAAVLLQRFFRGSPHVNSIRALSRFVFRAVLVAPAVAATIGAANVVLHRASPDYWHPWSAWFISNALTGLVILPAFITSRSSTSPGCAGCASTARASPRPWCWRSPSVRRRVRISRRWEPLASCRAALRTLARLDLGGAALRRGRRQPDADGRDVRRHLERGSRDRSLRQRLSG